MTGFLALYLLAILLGCWLAFRMGIIGFSGMSFAFGIFLATLATTHFPIKLGGGHAFLIWLLLPISYVCFGILLSRAQTNRADSERKFTCDVQNP